MSGPGASIAQMKFLDSKSRSVQARRGKTIVSPVLALLLLSFQLLAETAVPKQNAGGLSFLVISDWGGKGGTNQVAVAEQMGRTAQNLKSRFVITCGDNYHGNGIDSAESPRWKSEYEDIYKAPSLGIPWYPTLGNHDNRGNAAAEIEYGGMHLIPLTTGCSSSRAWPTIHRRCWNFGIGSRASRPAATIWFSCVGRGAFAVRIARVRRFGR